jgi:hypothetical protein
MLMTQVSFMPKESAFHGVKPPITEGKTDQVWVKTHTQEDLEIREAAIRKIADCYGIEIEVLSWGNQFEI